MAHCGNEFFSYSLFNNKLSSPSGVFFCRVNDDVQWHTCNSYGWVVFPHNTTLIEHSTHSHILTHQGIVHKLSLIKYTCTVSWNHTVEEMPVDFVELCCNAHLSQRERSPFQSWMYKDTSAASSFATVSWWKSLTFSERLCFGLALLRDSDIAKDAVVVAKGFLSRTVPLPHTFATHT